MNENNYLVQFVYAGKEYQTHLLSHNELEKNVLALENSAVMAARNHIKSVLDNQPELHDKYINESINELDRIQL